MYFPPIKYLNKSLVTQYCSKQHGQLDNFQFLSISKMME